MSGFDAREREFETRFALDEELKFKTRARRNRLVGVWAAQQLGIDGAAADQYAHELVELMFHPHGQEAILDRLAADFAKAKKPVTVEHIARELERCEREARHQIVGT